MQSEIFQKQKLQMVIDTVNKQLNLRLFQRYKQLALDNQVWLSLGCFPEYSKKTGQNYLTHSIINEEGNIAAKYRKMHMFDVDLEDSGGISQVESKSFVKGAYITEPCFSPVGYLGLSISYDLRFPELYRQLNIKGAQVLLVPSAILAKTGSVHWETILRTRAIENQCYVVASAQFSEHNVGNRFGFGHSMVIDPWGDIIAQCSDKEGAVLCELDLDYLDKVRSNMNCLSHMRTDTLLKPVDKFRHNRTRVKRQA